VTLFKQLALLVTLFLVVILVVVMGLNFASSQAFVQKQLHSNAQDTAASLALSLSQVLATQPAQEQEVMSLDDVLEESTVAATTQPLSKSLQSTLEVMISAIYDRGYYESIELINDKGEALVSRRQSVKLEKVPQWFLERVVLDVANASSDVTGAYGSRFATVVVKSHVGNAYEQLWGIFIDLLKTFAVLGVLFLVFLAGLIRLILRSLTAIEHQAKAITQHDFIIYDKVPFTLELRHVASAMNSMVGKVKEIFDKEAESLRKYYELLYTDTQTKLYNRRYVMMKLATFLAQEDEQSRGVFVMLTLQGVDEAKAKLGYQKLEALTVSMAQELKACATYANEGVAVRMNEHDYALLLPTLTLQEAQLHLDAMMDAIAHICESYGVLSVLKLSGGAVSYEANETLKALFSRADFELAKAKMAPQSTIIYAQASSANTLVMGKEEWIAMINSSLEENMLKVAAQKVIALKDNTSMHHEVYLRMVDGEGKVYNAGYFMPVLVNLNLTDAVDKHVIELAMYHAKLHPHIKSIAINISAHFLAVAANMEWIRQKITTFANHSEVVLSFEASNVQILQNIELFTHFSQMLHHKKFLFGIDNFAMSSEGLQYLKAVKPNYIKANKSLFFDLQAQENSAANDSLRMLTKSLGITLIATAVESQEQLTALKELGVDFVQGSVVEEPHLLGAKHV